MAALLVERRLVFTSVRPLVIDLGLVLRPHVDMISYVVPFREIRLRGLFCYATCG